MSKFKKPEAVLHVAFILNAQQLLQLHALSGMVNNMNDVFCETESLLKSMYGFEIAGDEDLGIDPRFFVESGRFIENPFVFQHTNFQAACKAAIDKQLSRKTVTVGDKTYYEDELQMALSNIKPINNRVNQPFD